MRVKSNDVKTVIMDVDYQYWMDEQSAGLFYGTVYLSEYYEFKGKDGISAG